MSYSTLRSAAAAGEDRGGFSCMRCSSRCPDIRKLEDHMHPQMSALLYVAYCFWELQGFTPADYLPPFLGEHSSFLAAWCNCV